MARLETKYMNLALKNPLIIASSGLTKTREKIKECEKAGAGAIVIKSLFEEVLAHDDWGLMEATSFHTEAYEYLRAELEKQYGPQDYCSLIFDVKKDTEIPVIASINCVSSKWWPSFAKQIEGAGADALELNVFNAAYDPLRSGVEIENVYIDILHQVRSKVKIPVAMKIGSNFSSLPNFASQLCNQGLNGLVLFNRFTEPDIDIRNLQLRTTFTYSRKEDISKPLRWVALLYDQISCDISATTGIHNAESVIKMLLAGATTVQIASAIYKNGLQIIAQILKEVEEWMLEHGFDCIDDFRGKLSFTKSKTPHHYLRAQFMEKIRGVE